MIKFDQITLADGHPIWNHVIIKNYFEKYFGVSTHPPSFLRLAVASGCLVCVQQSVVSTPKKLGTKSAFRNQFETAERLNFWQLFKQLFSLIRSGPEVPSLNSRPRSRSLSSRVKKMICAAVKTSLLTLKTTRNLRFLIAFSTFGVLGIRGYCSNVVMTTRFLHLQCLRSCCCHCC